jgi:hypothetical protein
MNEAAERMFRKLAESRKEKELLNEEARALPQYAYMPPLEKRSEFWYANFRALTLYKKQLQEMYEEASALDIDELLQATPGQLYKYQLLMDDWRKVSAILDDSYLHASEERQEHALGVLDAIVKQMV